MNITTKMNKSIDDAYAFYNEALFDNALPGVAIVFDKKMKNSLGYFSPQRWINDGGDIAHGIALNPNYFIGRSDMDILSTLVHEMVHLWQQVYGKPSRTTYHNNEFAKKMESVGLICSTTGLPGGKKVGQKMSHYIASGGAFEKLTSEWVKDTIFTWGSYDPPANKKKKTPSKVKYTCPTCELNIWAKPGLDRRIVCAECSEIEEGAFTYLIQETIEEDPESEE